MINDRGGSNGGFALGFLILPVVVLALAVRAEAVSDKTIIGGA
jgi:hypothetical protein